MVVCRGEGAEEVVDGWMGGEGGKAGPRCQFMLDATRWRRRLDSEEGSLGLSV